MSEITRVGVNLGKSTVPKAFTLIQTVVNRSTGLCLIAQRARSYHRPAGLAGNHFHSTYQPRLAQKYGPRGLKTIL
jgi:hypothetical protein